MALHVSQVTSIGLKNFAWLVEEIQLIIVLCLLFRKAITARRARFLRFLVSSLVRALEFISFSKAPYYIQLVFVFFQESWYTQSLPLYASPAIFRVPDNFAWLVQGPQFINVLFFLIQETTLAQEDSFADLFGICVVAGGQSGRPAVRRVSH